MNLIEVRVQEKNVDLIMSYQVENNLHSDADFGEEFIDQDPLSNEIDSLSV
ncbi:hypothetical protein [Schinkia azotoformans]|uniref:hypothetical protein n=1 Tax=Schinkia azotoformans TaxID=1454 RepID=UPI000B0CCFF9|nr:hypothetical protein [Schinkia azotoformans]MEC1697356.1 hypothetical protein [Schinkia azotoformans]MEC1718499.1 hypothetical protein [Schinkia azotoformans]MEC1724384.1 hypothetical protein [Schinkia azotoformans]MEC1742124.1 hypothetical protein [Schinkia azotoformans]MEC1747418.1 hypothetical protein [Schinkia azotoformans]